MKEQKKQFKDQILTSYLSFGHIGFIPKAPGTFGSIAALPLLYWTQGYNQSLLFALLLIIAIFVTCKLTHYYQQKFHLHDPGWIVIDEVLGMLTAWMFCSDYQITHYFIILGIFRVFDIFKIWPATFFDNMKHGAGTILDDIVSGIFAGLTYQLGKFVFDHF